MRHMTDIVVYASNDIPRHLEANGGTSPAVRRRQANMLRFGNGNDPIVIPGAAAAQQARAVALQERRAAAKERQCNALQFSIARSREAPAGVTAQCGERADSQIARIELAYAQQCSR